MGIDWITERKPINGKEEQFIKLRKYLRYLYNDETTSNTKAELIEKLESNLYNISISPHDVHTNIGVLFCGDDIYESNLIDEELKEEAGNDHNSLQTIDYANRLEICISNIDINKLDDDDKEDYNCILEAIKWLKFWGQNGHGFVISY
jgi:hypothetical protein